MISVYVMITKGNLPAKAEYVSLLLLLFLTAPMNVAFSNEKTSMNRICGKWNLPCLTNVENDPSHAPIKDVSESAQSANTSTAQPLPAFENEQKAAQAEIEKGAALEKGRLLDAERDRRLAEKIAIEKQNAAEQANLEKAKKLRQMTEQQTKSFQYETNIVKKSRKSIVEGKPLAHEEIKKISDPQIRDDLFLVSTATTAKRGLEKEKDRISLHLAKLLEMAAITAKNSNAMNSLTENTYRAAATTPVDPAQSQASAKTSAKLGDKAAISKADPLADELTDGEEGSTLSAEARAKLKEGIAAAERRKRQLALKNDLKARLGEKGAKGSPSDAVDPANTDNLFSGKLTADAAERAGLGEGRSLASTSSQGSAAADHPIFQAMGAMQNHFGMNEIQTEAEVKRLLADAEEALGSAETLAGVLGVETASLFERVSAAHKNCVRAKCVLTAIR